MSPYSSLNVFDDGAVLLGTAFWTVSIALMFFKPQRFKGWFFPTLLGPVDRPDPIDLFSPEDEGRTIP
jgi:hypothetical protein